MVTSKGVGLAVPDWPTTFGYNMFLFPVSKWIGGIFFEHTHRLIASAVGFLTIILAIWLWRSDDRRWVRVLGVIALASVILQGILGGLRVTMLKDEIGIFHACLAQAFLGLLVFIALVTTKFWRAGAMTWYSAEYNSAGRTWQSPKFRKIALIKGLAIAITAAIYVQLALGATMRHQHRDLAILDFPTANGAWLPDTSETALAKINAWRDARLVGRGWVPNLAANGPPLSRAVDCDRDHCILSAGSERCARHRRAQESVALLGRAGRWPNCARVLDDLEQQGR